MSEEIETATSTTVYSIPRHDGEEIQFALRKYKGKYYVDLRLWFQSEENQRLMPSKKGIALDAERLPELREGLQHLDEAFLKTKTASLKSTETRNRTLPSRPQQSWASRTSKGQVSHG